MPTTPALEGWMLDTIVAHDVYHPGFAGHYMRASDERRQIMAAFFAVASHNNAASNNSASFLTHASHQNILRCAFECVPPGLRGALGKSGSQPHEPAYYHDLCEALAFGFRHVVTTIMHVTILNPERLAIIKALPLDLCDSRIVERIDSIKQARDLIAVVDFFEARAGNRARLITALLESRAPLETIIRRWSRQIEYVDHPIHECVGYRPIRTGLDLHEAARRYQNCGRNYSVASLVGENAFGEFVALDGRRVLLCFDRSEGEWALEGVYGRRNRPVADDLEAQARGFVRLQGIRDRWQSDRSEDDISRALRRMIQPYSQW